MSVSINKVEENKTERLKEIVNHLVQPMGKSGIGFKIWIAFLSILAIAALAMYIKQIQEGLSVTAMRDIASWGIYISNFVFLVAVSLVGSLITAILKLNKIKWATSLTRISEIIAVAAVIFALIIIVVDMGRPERLLNIFMYGRLQSPIVWDIIVVNTYLVISLLLLYLPLIPDLALLRKYKTDVPKWQSELYRILSLGWQGTDEQYKILKKSINILMVLIIPVAFAIHTVTSWLFASTLRPGWDSTIFGPYFIAGAFMVGAAAVVVAMYIFRVKYNYQCYLTDYHFNMMGKLLVLTSLIYLYFNVNEFMVPFYKMKTAESSHIKGLFSGEFSMMFWMVQILGMIIPIILLLFKKFRKPKPMMIIAVIVVIGAFFKRYLIVTPTLLHPFLPVQNYPESYHHYVPSFEEWTITLGSIAGVLLIISVFVKIFPIIPIWEVAHEEGIDNDILNK
ncbi:MAG: polysulfide reductase [Bacteroidetes bacterium GWA2_31_9]|nr:MAG: polysulfide reductase [Bacteroidetes bacterium GWA2_31_9]